MGVDRSGWQWVGVDGSGWGCVGARFSMNFSNSHVTSHWARVGVSHGKPATCLVWCPQVSRKLRYNVLNLSRDLTRLIHLGGHANLWVGCPHDMSLP